MSGYGWAKDSIERLAEAGVIQGDGPNTFGPGKNITRADFAVLLVRAFAPDTGAAEENFADVSPEDYFAEELAKAKAAGIARGIGNNRFNPRGQVTRQDMMVMLARAMDAAGIELPEADAEELKSFTDGAQVADYAREAVSRLVKDGIIAGDKGRINPQGYATRAEVAVVLDRILQREE